MKEVCLRVLDFVVLKVLILCFARYCICSQNLERYNWMEMPCFSFELARILSSGFDFKEVLAEEPLLIQYENEFYLINANSMSNNSNELTNLKEVNDELVVKINDLKRRSIVYKQHILKFLIR